jgi:nitroreductase
MADTYPSVLELLTTRRSVSAKEMSAPGPTPDQVEQILEAAHRVPDHGKLGPWRFIVFQGDARARFGQELAKIHTKQFPDISSKCLAVEENRLTRAPLVITVVANIMEHHKIPQWEQELSVGAACQNILIAAHALGFGAQWLTEWYSYNDDVRQILGLSETEKLAGFIYIGSYDEKPAERVRPSLEERVVYW